MIRATRRRPWDAVAPVTGLVFSAVLLAVAPVFMPTTYDWVRHTTSESAAQGIDMAWVARLGFTTFGISVIALSVTGRPRWNIWARISHFGFGLFMTMAAAASARPWFEPATFDPSEDWVHSFAATAMGFAFAGGVLAVTIGRARIGPGIRLLDAMALVASVVFPVGMGVVPNAAGLLQRAMFLVAYGWYITESLRNVDPADQPPGLDSRTNPAEV